MPGTTDDRGEDGAGSVISSEAGLAHARSVVHHQSGYFFVAHPFRLLISWKSGNEF